MDIEVTGVEYEPPNPGFNECDHHRDMLQSCSLITRSRISVVFQLNLR